MTSESPVPTLRDALLGLVTCLEEGGNGEGWRISDFLERARAALAAVDAVDPKYERVGWYRTWANEPGASLRNTEPPDSTNWEPVYRRVRRDVS